MEALGKIIQGIIATQGPMSVAAYMDLALQHPVYGYYRTREPLGRDGDFITAPEISQMFGEMVGVWCVEAWRALGEPQSFGLVEFGPGRGTMMLDILRSTANVAGFSSARKLFLIDSNEVLRKIQRKVLEEALPEYLDDIADAPNIPLIIVANEFFDALTVRQFEKTFRGWAERMVCVENGRFGLTLRPLAEAEEFLVPETMRDALPGTVFEFSPQSQVLMREIVKAMVARRGKMLLIDYGYVAYSGTATVQAVSRHSFADIFDRPGDVDLTAHVDFSALSEVAKANGANVSAVVGQGEFLKNAGIEIRAEALKVRANQKQADEIESALRLLTDEKDMGELFKVLEVAA